MAASAAQLACFIAADAEAPFGGVALNKKNGLTVLQFQGQQTGAKNSQRVRFNFTIPGPSASGYSGTTGFKVKILWSSNSNGLTGAVVWGAAFQLSGATDLPLVAQENFPADNSSNEILATTSINATTAGGLNITTISVTIAEAQNGQTTAPAIGDFMRLQIRRVTENAADTLTDNAFIHAVQVIDY
jgi:hypothetical protein